MPKYDSPINELNNHFSVTGIHMHISATPFMGGIRLDITGRDVDPNYNKIIKISEKYASQYLCSLEESNRMLQVAILDEQFETFMNNFRLTNFFKKEIKRKMTDVEKPVESEEKKQKLENETTENISQNKFI